MEKIIINLANKDYEVKINFKKSYDLTKYRNRLTFGIDFTEADKPILKEILKLQTDAQKKGKNLTELDLSKLSPEATQYLMKMSKEKEDIFNYDELVEIGKIFTDITDNNELLNVFDEEVLLNGYDVLVAKLTNTITSVFMSAKSI